jgi:hypothetical protein
MGKSKIKIKHVLYCTREARPNNWIFEVSRYYVMFMYSNSMIYDLLYFVSYFYLGRFYPPHNKQAMSKLNNNHG